MKKKATKSAFGRAIKSEVTSFILLMRSVPSYVTVLFVMSVFSMNLLANKSISGLPDWLALDCGIIVSWAAFLAMDMVTKRFGPRAANSLSLFAIACNLLFCLVMFAGSAIPGDWGESFTHGAAVNAALDKTFGGTWYVILGSTAAFAVSAIINNTLNYAVGKLFKRNPDGAAAYFLRSWVSTAVAQFADNLLFAFIVSHFFFGWSALQCVTCALTGMAAELLCEVLFSYIGYAVSARWQKQRVGEKYLRYRTLLAKLCK